MSYETLYDAYREQITYLAEAGVDLLVAETMLASNETMVILDAAASVCDLPVFCTLTMEADGSLFFGGNIFDAVEELEALGAAAVGCNCSTGPDQLVSVISGIRSRVSVPVIAKPNAGMPTISETGEAVYHMGPQGLRPPYEGTAPGRRFDSRRLLRHDAGIYQGIEKQLVNGAHRTLERKSKKHENLNRN